MVDDLESYNSRSIEEIHPQTLSLKVSDIEQKAMQTAVERQYPASLAQYFGSQA
ncbi:hypothetical protein JCM19233_5459 [Vibrio astriarenae]|nr:hypothetical protein JCM19233_5459 [Vibrio sp. C7]